MRRTRAGLSMQLGYLILSLLAFHAICASTFLHPPIRSFPSIDGSPGSSARRHNGADAGPGSANGSPRTSGQGLGQASAQGQAAAAIPAPRPRRGTVDGYTPSHTAGTAIGQGQGAGLIKPKPDLRHRSIYQILTDRFGLDLGSNEDGTDKIVRCDPDERRYCGGTWKGIERRLGYIQGMGFDTGAYECCRYLGILRDVVRA